MIVWALALLLALAAVATVARLAHPAWRPAAACAALGLLGYAITGQPMLGSRPPPQLEPDLVAGADYAESRRLFLARFGDSGAWLTLADALIRGGRSADAVDWLNAAIAKEPRNPDLWVALGNALTLHARGPSPASAFAYAKAEALSPSDPAPDYFRGLAELYAGRPGRALGYWQPLRARAPADAPWLPDVDRRIAAARRMVQAAAR